MEFYELNRLYDETLKYTKPSDRVDSYLYFLMPTVISFGCVISLISIYSFAMHRNQPRRMRVYLTSKAYLYAQSVANFAFQLVTSVILITNYYEIKLIDTYFQNNKNTYFSLKCFLNFLYNVLLYSVMWFVVVAAFDFCVVAIKKLNLHATYSKHYRHMFERLLKTHQMHNLRHQHHNKHSIHHHHNNNHQASVVNKQFHHSRPANMSIKSTRHLEVDKGNSNRTRCSSTTSCSYQPNEFISMEELNQQPPTMSPQTIAGAMGSMDMGGGGDEIVQFATTMSGVATTVTAGSTAKLIETDRIFCKTKTIYYSIFSIVFFSLVLAFPQIFAYEIRQNEISLSPSRMPKGGGGGSDMTPPTSSYEHIYFVEADHLSTLNNSAEYKEHLKEEKLFRQLNQTSLSYSDTVGRALAYAIRIDTRDQHIVGMMRKTHRRFFTQTGFFNLLSRQYEFCNVLKNSLDAAPIIVRPSPRSARAVIKIVETGERINYFNLTLTCIKKNDLNTYLTYNTLYFWLEHTMVISVPFCVNLVVGSSLVYTFLTFTKLQTHQYRFLLKRRRLAKLLKKGLSKNHQTLYIHEHHLSRKESKRYRPAGVGGAGGSSSAGGHKPGSEINIMSEEFVNELRELEAYETRMLRKQHDDKNLTLMFILDMLFYFLFSFPYTLMRLILDLFVKDKVKISLDFFVLFKSSLLAFHLHLIAKFFLMVAMDVNFRKSIAWAFSIQNSACWRADDEQQPGDNERGGGGGGRGAGSGPRRSAKNCLFTTCFCCCCCCCCDDSGKRGSEPWRWQTSSSPTDSNLDAAEASVNLYRDYTSYDGVDEDNFYHSTEFNSNYHQFYCPAEPTESDLMPNLLPNNTTTAAANNFE